MITKLRLRNFKRIDDQTYEFGELDLLLGRNNSGKSTVLQAIAIWQFCIDEFRRAKPSRKGESIQVVLTNFTALPVPEFNLLWHNRSDRYNEAVEVSEDDSQASKKYVSKYHLIGIQLEWEQSNTDYSFNVEIRYHSPQTIYAIPADGWDRFRELDKLGVIPKIAYVPPF